MNKLVLFITAFLLVACSAPVAAPVPTTESLPYKGRGPVLPATYVPEQFGITALDVSEQLLFPGEEFRVEAHTIGPAGVLVVIQAEVASLEEENSEVSIYPKEHLYPEGKPYVFILEAPEKPGEYHVTVRIVTPPEFYEVVYIGTVIDVVPMH